MRKPRRGPPPIARTDVDLNSDVDILQRRIGDGEESATTVQDLKSAGVVTQTSDGSLAVTKTAVGGPQGLYDYLKGFGR
jgi:hypothetical protein